MQLVEQPTHVTETIKTLIDHFITNSKTNLTKWGTITTSISDHYLIYAMKRGISIEKCSSTPLHNHLKSKHANELSKAVKRKSNDETHSKNQPPMKQLCIQESLDSSSYPQDSLQYVGITRSIAKMIALDCQPFSIVTDEGFITLMKVAKPR
jgi:hypothetical protein